MCFKPKTTIARLLLNLSILYAIFYNQELMLEVCGPFTHPLKPKLHLLTIIMLMEVFRMFYAKIAGLTGKLPFLNTWSNLAKQFITVKYLLVLIIKITLIFENDHRKKYYLHTCLLEGTIIMAAAILDCFRRANISEAGQLLIVEGLHRLALVYQLTQTFCPNLVLYYMTANLLVFVMAQVQGQERFGLKTSLFVKHDVYRLMLILFVYFGLVGVAQLSITGPKTLLTFLLSLKFMHCAVINFDEQSRWVSVSLLGISLVVGLGQLVDSTAGLSDL